MAGLWVNDEATKEGKYPVVLRRDGTQVDFPHFLISVHDPGFPAAMTAYADALERLDSDEAYVRDCFEMADAAKRGEFGDPPRKSDPDAPRHRADDVLLLAWARSGLSLRQFLVELWGEFVRAAIDLRFDYIAERIEKRQKENE